MHRKLIGASFVLALLQGLALAQSAPSPERAEAREKVRIACAADVEKFCANIERVRGARRACLEEHEKQLSAPCKAARAERAAMRAKDKS